MRLKVRLDHHHFYLFGTWSIGIILLLSFFIFQACVRLVAGPERVTQRAFEKMKHRADQLEAHTPNPVLLQLKTVLELNTMLAYRESLSGDKA